ncbi:hypothetical protein ColKHC_08426 [Colletotrichum higginsianum]|nr:hypothetical protein ColKHC_08426 [Colletotrichum higginsianum]
MNHDSKPGFGFTARGVGRCGPGWEADGRTRDPLSEMSPWTTEGPHSISKLFKMEDGKVFILWIRNLISCDQIPLWGLAVHLSGPWWDSPDDSTTRLLVDYCSN